jgi:glycosyltransferase involved in cell wall biosynthesis
MKIVIDARMYGLEHAGIGRYVSNFVRELTSHRSLVTDHQFFLLVRKDKFAEVKKEVDKSFKLVIADYPHYSFQEQILLPIKLLKIKPDLVHFPHFNLPIFYFGKFVVTIHDLIKHESRGRETTTRWQPLYWFKYLNYQFLIWVVVKRAKMIIVPSNYWKKELVQRFKLKPEKIVVTYEGVDSRFRSPVTGHRSPVVLSKYKISKPFLIYTGNLYPHKNVERLVEAVKLVNSEQRSVARKKTPVTLPTQAGSHQSPVTLVIVCSRNIFYDRFKKKLKEMKAEQFVHLIGFVPDEELVDLYREAEAFVFPSLLEGFGLPGLEAMAVGLPVVSSKASCLPEIYGDAALYFDPHDLVDMTDKIQKMIEDKEIRKELIKKGFEQVKKYSWQKMAQETLRVYQDAFEK